MKSTMFLFVVLISFIATPSLAQRTKVKPPFRAWVKASSGAKIEGLRGPAYLVELKESSVIIAHLVDIKTNTFRTKEYSISEIATIKFRQEKIVGRSVLVSSLVGFTLGGISGGILGGDSLVGPETTIEAVFLYGSIIGVIAAIYAGPVFSLKIKVHIKGNQATYEKEKETLQKFLLDQKILTRSY